LANKGHGSQNITKHYHIINVAWITIDHLHR